MKRIRLLKDTIVIIMFLIPVFSFAQVNVLIDSLVFRSRTTEKAIIIENKIGDRTEYLFNTSNSLTYVNRSYLSNSLGSAGDQRLRYYVDSHFYKNDSIYSKFYTYLVTESEGEYFKTLENQDSSTFAISDDQKKDYGDSIIWFSGKKEIRDKYILTKTNGQFVKYSYQFNLPSRDLVKTWMVEYQKQKIFLIDTSHSKLNIDYDIIILKKSKHGTPKTIYTYDWLFASFKEPEIMEYIMSKRQTRKPLLVFEIMYCLTDDCLNENSLETKTVKMYLKFIKKYPYSYNSF